jgi:hypothetical protein
MHLQDRKGKCILEVARPGVSPGEGGIACAGWPRADGERGGTDRNIIDVNVRKQIESSQTASTPRELFREETGHDS